MALNPLIPLQARTPDAAPALNQLVQAVQQGPALQQRRLNQQQNQLVSGQQFNQQNVQKIGNVALVAESVLPKLNNGDIEGAVSEIENYRDKSKRMGIDLGIDDSDIQLLKTNPERAKQVLQQAIDLNKRIVAQGLKPGETPSSVREYEYFNKLGPEEQARYLNVKRQGFSLGGQRFDPAGNIVIGSDITARAESDIAGAKKKSEIEAEEGTATGQAGLAKAQAEAEAKRAELNDRIGKAQTDAVRAEDIKSIVDNAANNKALKNVFGTVAGRVPSVRQDTVDLEADIDRVMNLMSLAARGELKGQGQISDFEGKMLKQAQTILSDRKISPDRAREELTRISELMQDIMARGAKNNSVSTLSDDDLLNF